MCTLPGPRRVPAVREGRASTASKRCSHVCLARRATTRTPLRPYGHGSQHRHAARVGAREHHATRTLLAHLVAFDVGPYLSTHGAGAVVPDSVAFRQAAFEQAAFEREGRGEVPCAALRLRGGGCCASKEEALQSGLPPVPHSQVGHATPVLCGLSASRCCASVCRSLTPQRCGPERSPRPNQ